MTSKESLKSALGNSIVQWFSYETIDRTSSVTVDTKSVVKTRQGIKGMCKSSTITGLWYECSVVFGKKYAKVVSTKCECMARVNTCKHCCAICNYVWENMKE